MNPSWDLGNRARAVAKTAKDGPQVRRLLALAAIYDGGTRGAAARIGGVTLQIVRDPVLRFNASGAVGLINRKARRDAGSGRCRSLMTRPAWRWPRLALAPSGAGPVWRWRRGSSRDRHRAFTVWCAGGSQVAARGY